MWTLAWLSLGLALLSLGCGADPGESRLVTRTAFFLDGAPLGTQRLTVAPQPGLDLLDADGWFPLLESESPADLAKFLASASQSGGLLRAGAESGCWAQIVELPPHSDVLLSGRIEFQDIHCPDNDGVPVGVQLGLAELRQLPSEGSLALSRELLQKVTWTAALQGDQGDQPVELLLRTTRFSRAVVVLCVQPWKLPPTARSVFRDVRLQRASSLDRVALASRQPSDALDAARPLVGRFTLGAVERPGVAVLAGAEVDLPGLSPDGPLELRFEAGVVPVPELPGKGSVPLELVLAELGSTEPLLTLRLDLPVRAEGLDRWLRRSLPLPSTLPKGTGLTLTVRCLADQSVAGIAVLANPRMVPLTAARSGPNLLLISLDTLRADRLGCYGYERDTTPFIDALAERSLLVRDTWSNGPFTLPSHASMLTGQMPTVHGVQSSGARLDPQRSPTMARLLHDRGYATAAFTGGGYVHPQFGFSDGFDRYGTMDPLANLDSERVQELLGRAKAFTPELVAEQSVQRAAQWIGERGDQPFMMFFHSYAAHQFDAPDADLAALGLEHLGPLFDDEGCMLSLTQFESPPADVVARLSDRYDASVRQADAGVGVLLEALADNDLLQHTLVVVTSDHGKELGERGMVAHGHSLYEEMLQVPLIVHVPGGPVGQLQGPAMLVDIVPTLAPLLGLQLWHPVQGMDLLGGWPRARCTQRWTIWPSCRPCAWAMTS